MNRIESVRKNNLPFDHMEFQEEGVSWEQIASNYVIDLGAKKRIMQYVKMMHDAKLQTERMMKRELEHKIVQMRQERQVLTLGKEIAEKLRFWINKFWQHVAENSKELP